MKKAALYVSLILMLVAMGGMTFLGMLGNFAGNFLLFGSIVTTVLTVVAFARKRIDWGAWQRDRRDVVFRVTVRVVSFLLLGLAINISIIPAQLGESAPAWSLGMWSAALLLSGLAFIPRETNYRPMTMTLVAMSLFIAFHVVTIFVEPARDDAVKAQSPFKDDWLVFHGGNSALINHHFLRTSNKYALDLVIAGDAALPGQLVTDITQYETFGKEVYAPVAGTVVSVENGIVDQPVGSVDNINFGGNYVVIEVEAGVNVILAHLQEGSVVVSEGALVSEGQLLGRIGNSGQTTQPHLHIHAMSLPDMLDPESEPIPMFWKTGEGLVFHQRNDMLRGF